MYGDSAYASSRSERVIAARGGRPRTVQTGVWGGAEALARVQAHNAEVQAVRARIEKVFGTCKRSYGLRRMRWLGLAKAGLQVRLTAIAYNLRRSWRLLKPYRHERHPEFRLQTSLPKPNGTGRSPNPNFGQLRSGQCWCALR